MSQKMCHLLFCSCLAVSLCLGHAAPSHKVREFPHSRGGRPGATECCCNRPSRQLCHRASTKRLRCNGEDGIPQKVSTFAEGTEVQLATWPMHHRQKPLANTFSGNAQQTAACDTTSSGADGHCLPRELSAFGYRWSKNVFVLFDTSNYMYRGFVFAQDAITDFIRSLEGADRIAFYSYSRDFHPELRG